MKKFLAFFLALLARLAFRLRYRLAVQGKSIVVEASSSQLDITNFDAGGEYENTSSFTFVNPYPGKPDLESSLAAYGDDSIAGLTNDYSLDLYADPTTQGYTAVPEPTSGLLLLLGMAGLALRRKRA